MDYKKISKYATIVGTVVTLAFFYYCWRAGIFTDQSVMQSFLAKFGIAAGMVYIVLQIIQVIIPIIPGGVSCLVGVIIFGNLMGFVYNYVGICIGSILAFLIAKKYGRGLLHSMFDQKLIEKYEKWTDGNHRFTKMFAAAIFFPVAPDDFLCYLAGTTKMKLQTFTTIILLGKPLSIFIYSMGLNTLLHAALSGLAL